MGPHVRQRQLGVACEAGVLRVGWPLHAHVTTLRVRDLVAEGALLGLRGGTGAAGRPHVVAAPGGGAVAVVVGRRPFGPEGFAAREHAGEEGGALAGIHRIEVPVGQGVRVAPEGTEQGDVEDGRREVMRRRTEAGSRASPRRGFGAHGVDVDGEGPELHVPPRALAEHTRVARPHRKHRLPVLYTEQRESPPAQRPLGQHPVPPLAKHEPPPGGHLRRPQHDVPPSKEQVNRQRPRHPRPTPARKGPLESRQREMNRKVGRSEGIAMTDPSDLPTFLFNFSSRRCPNAYGQRPPRPPSSRPRRRARRSACRSPTPTTRCRAGPPRRPSASRR